MLSLFLRCVLRIGNLWQQSCCCCCCCCCCCFISAVLKGTGQSEVFFFQLQGFQGRSQMPADNLYTSRSKIPCPMFLLLQSNNNYMNSSDKSFHQMTKQQHLEAVTKVDSLNYQYDLRYNIFICCYHLNYSAVSRWVNTVAPVHSTKALAIPF